MLLLEKNEKSEEAIDSFELYLKKNENISANVL